MRRLILAVLLAAMCLSLAAPLQAQRFLGTLTGTVTDSTGAVVPDADVTATDQGTGFTRTVKTDKDGVYSIAQAPLGNYKVTASRAGFKQYVKTDVVLHVADVQRVDITLQPGT